LARRRDPLGRCDYDLADDGWFLLPGEAYRKATFVALSDYVDICSSERASEF